MTNKFFYAIVLKTNVYKGGKNEVCTYSRYALRQSIYKFGKNRRTIRYKKIRAKKNIKKVIDSLRKEFKKLGVDLKYINVTEYKNKAIHHHLLINHIEGQDVSKMVRRLWKFGRPDFKYLDDTGQYKDLAAYLIKETSKTYKENDGGHKQRYSCSRNLIMPTPKTEIIKKAQRWAADPKTQYITV